MSKWANWHLLGLYARFQKKTWKGYTMLLRRIRALIYLICFHTAAFQSLIFRILPAWTIAPANSLTCQAKKIDKHRKAYKFAMLCGDWIILSSVAEPFSRIVIFIRIDIRAEPSHVHIIRDISRTAKVRIYTDRLVGVHVFTKNEEHLSRQKRANLVTNLNSYSLYKRMWFSSREGLQFYATSVLPMRRRCRQ